MVSVPDVLGGLKPRPIEPNWEPWYQGPPRDRPHYFVPPRGDEMPLEVPQAKEDAIGELLEMLQEARRPGMVYLTDPIRKDPERVQDWPYEPHYTTDPTIITRPLEMPYWLEGEKDPYYLMNPYNDWWAQGELLHRDEYPGARQKFRKKNKPQVTDKFVPQKKPLMRGSGPPEMPKKFQHEGGRRG